MEDNPPCLALCLRKKGIKKLEGKEISKRKLKATTLGSLGVWAKTLLEASWKFSM